VFATILEKKHLVQAEAAKVLGISQPKVSALIRYKLEGFSVERLMLFLTCLDRDVEIVIKKKGSARKPARITVIAA
jgi:predicted XRE-type DNA-binding protein